MKSLTPLARWLVVFVLIILLGLAVLFGLPFIRQLRESKVVWFMINVSPVHQADAHYLRFPDGSSFLIDVGSGGDGLVKFIQKNKIKHIDKILITHAHRDHYGGLREILHLEGLTIGSVAFNRPPKEVCDSEIPWGCVFSEVEAVFEEIRRGGLPLHEIKRGDILYQSGKTRLEVLFVHDGVSPPVGKTDINDMSPVILLTQGNIKALFTGDLNEKMGTYLAENEKRIKANLLKVPHHGAEKLAGRDFFEAVGAEVAFVPASLSLWAHERTKRVRDYFKEKKIENYVSGRDLDIKVTIFESGYRISKGSKD